MTLSTNNLDAITGIARVTSVRGRGLSLRDALDQAQYRTLRSQLRAKDLASYLEQHPEVVEEWELFSMDKRTDGGWYFRRHQDVWQVGRMALPWPKAYSSAAKSCAAFIVHELDYWAEL
jgi:hypothetical protein